jgi:type VI secretion system protein ImpA
MAAPPSLDFAALLAPVPGDDPSGSPIPLELRQQLEDARREDDPDDYEPDDPMRPETFRRADWSGIVRLSEATLTQSSKDLLVAARLTEALVRLHGFAGLRDGLHLLRELVEQCWDRLRPPVEDGDVEVRAAPFFWLDDPDKGARLPTTIRRVPLVARQEVNQEITYSRADWDSGESKDPRHRVPREDFDKAVASTSVERCEQLVEEMTQAREELEQLGRSLEARLGPAAPGLGGLRQAVTDCLGLMLPILKKKRPELPTEGDTNGEEQAPAAGRPAPGSRAKAYRQLAEAAALLRELEPHSPIPYLVQRAVELGELPFPQLMKALIRDANVLTELNRELGIQEPPPPSS